MKMLSRSFFALGLMAAVAAVAVTAQAFGTDIAALVVQYPTIALGLSGLAMMGETKDVTPEMIQATLKKLGDDLKDEATKSFKEVEKFGEMTTKQKSVVDEMLVKQTALIEQMSQAEQKLVELSKSRGDQDQDQKSYGQQLVESEDYKNWVKAGGMKSTQSGFVLPVKAITSLSDSAGAGIAPTRLPGIVMPPERRMTIRDLLTPGSTDSNLVQYVRETGFTNNAATVSETVQKPESTITYTLEQSPVVTIAHWIKAAKQVLDDFKALRSNIDGRLRYGLRLIEEAQLLKGSGTGNNLRGIYTQATAYSAPIVIASATKIDVLRLMLLQAELAEYPATGIVLHPSDWTAIELTKDTTGSYIFANPQSLAQPVMWGRPVVATQAMTVDTALVGAFRMGAQIFDREDANVVISTENQDDFIKNMVTIRAEERLALAVYRPEAFVKNTDLPAA